MPSIKVNLGDVQTYESLPVGKYLADIEAAVMVEAKEEGKFEQLKVQFLVVEGDFTGRRQSMWLSFSPKADFMMKRFFNHFELGDLEDINFDDDTLELIEPDIVGSRVIFEVTQDRKDKTRLNTNLYSVEESTVGGYVATAPQSVAVEEEAAPAEEEEAAPAPRSTVTRAPVTRAPAATTTKRTLR